MNEGQLYCNHSEADNAIQPLLRGQPLFEDTHHFVGFENRMRDGWPSQYPHCMHLFRVVGDNPATAGRAANFYLIEYKLHIPVRFAKSPAPQSQYRTMYYTRSIYGVMIPPNDALAGLRPRSDADGGFSPGNLASL